MDGANPNTALASAMVEELARCGVRHSVISPGSRSTPLALALWRAPAIDATVVVDERAAGFVALGAAQATQTPVAVLCTSGTAAANLHPAVSEADESGIPLLVLTADRPPELRGIGAGQTIDQLKLYGGAVRWFCELGTHDADDAGLLHFRSVACRAFAAAGDVRRPGPVHLNVPWRDPLGDEPAAGEVTATASLALEGRGQRPLTAVAAAPAAPDEFMLSELARHLSEAERPLIVAGRQPDPALAAPVARLAATVGAPVLAEPTSQVRFGPHDRSNVISCYDAIARSQPAPLEPDLILRFGEMPTSKALRTWITALHRAPQLVVASAGGWNEPTRHAAAIVRADAIALAAGLAEHAEACEPAWARSWLEADARARETVAAGLEGTELSEPAVHLALAEAYADGDLVYTASSMPIRDQEVFATGTPADAHFLSNRGANGIDGLLASGIGAAVATGRPTWILTGDLGLFHDLNSLSLLRDSGAAVRLVVFDNAGGGIFEFLPQAGQVSREEFEALFGTPTGLDCERAAALWGLPHRRIGRAAEIGRGVGRSEVIEVPVDRRRGVELRGDLMRAAASAAAQSVSA